jgi:hypothetical protein
MIVFSGDVNLLIAAPMLQDSFVDKDGTPMSGGTVTCYHDNSRTTLKNWYYQVGQGGTYIYIALPNPLTLSAAGTICDINGVDTIPFFYPYDETDENIRDPYYITIVNHAQTNQITRENFPFVAPGGGTLADVNTFNNLIINNGFWRNIQPNTVNVTPYTSVTLNNIMLVPESTNLYAAPIAPSQHDGLRWNDIQFLKNNVSGNDVVTFIPFPLGTAQPISNNIVPEYYLNHVCNVPGTNESTKCYNFPVSLHVNSLDSVPFTFSIQAQNGGGTSPGQNVITIFILQDTGTGGSPVAPIEVEQFVLTTGWELYVATGVFPSTAGLNLGLGADDALYIQVQMPLNIACNINFTKPSVYLTQNLLPTNDFSSYGQVDAVVNSPRTGDIRSSVAGTYPYIPTWAYGWLAMNDGTIGNASSNATTRQNADTWPLFKTLWHTSATYSSFSGMTNPICQMYDSSGTPVAYGPYISAPTTAISDFNANRQLSLTRMMGRVMMGTVSVFAALAGAYSQTVTGSSSGGGSPTLILTCTNGAYLFQGQPISFFSGILPGGLSGRAYYYVTNIGIAGANTFQVSTTYAGAIAGTGLISYTTPGSGTIIMKLDSYGASPGEYAHQQLAAEVGAHTHTAATAMALNISNVASGGLTNFVAGSATSATVTVPSFASGSFTTVVNANSDGSPFNVVQPATLYHMFIKL